MKKRTYLTGARVEDGGCCGEPSFLVVLTDQGVEAKELHRTILGTGSFCSTITQIKIETSDNPMEVTFT